MGFNFVETVLSDGLCLISDGKGGDCLWANVFQLSAFCFFAWKNQKHQHNRHYHRCARTAEGKAGVACVSRGVPLARAHCLKFYTRVRGYATHPAYDYTNLETNAEGDCGTQAAACLFSQNSKSSLHFPIPKVRAAFVPCGVFRRPKILFRLLNINQAFQHAVQSAVHGNLVDFLGNFFQCFQFFQT